MDPLLDPFGTPNIAINPNPDPSTFATLKGQWDEFLADPKGRGALASFGLALMQPVGVGQSVAGHVGQAIGNAGEAVQEAGVRENKAASQAAQADLATARAGAATSRAETAAVSAGRMGDRARNESEKLSLRRQELESRDKYRLLSVKVRAQANYAKEKKAHNDAQALSRTPTPFEDYKTWLANGGLAKTLAEEDTTAPAPVDTADEDTPDSGGSVAAPSIDEGTIVRNPKTGERLKLKNGKWVPL